MLAAPSEILSETLMTDNCTRIAGPPPIDYEMTAQCFATKHAKQPLDTKNE